MAPDSNREMEGAFNSSSVIVPHPQPNVMGKDGEDNVTSEMRSPVGMTCEAKNLYQKLSLRTNTKIWSEKPPDRLPGPSENGKTKKYALLVRKKVSEDPRKALEIDSILVQSPLLKRFLEDVVGTYPGISLRSARVVFQRPFVPFVHRWRQFHDAMHLNVEKHDEATRQHAKLLFDILHEELRDTIAAVNDYVENNFITFKHIWTLFQPEETIYMTNYGREMAVCQVGQGQIQNTPEGDAFVIKYQYVDWDGAKFGFAFVNNEERIQTFIGTVAITDLGCFPLKYHPDKDAIEERLVARGKLFLDLAGCSYKLYTTNAVESRTFSSALVPAAGRIVIDAAAYARYNPNDQVSLRPLKQKKTPSTSNETTESALVGFMRDRRKSVGSDYDEYYNPYTRRGRNKGLTVPSSDTSKRVVLTRDQLILCKPVVRGYSLRIKRWLEFFIDAIDDITFSDTAFSNLVLPTGHKDLILAVAQSQVLHKDKFDDVIMGKGRGIIMLLLGGPGIGKTLTAESVAEIMRVPLYVMSAGNLGSSSNDVEENLTRILDMVARWNAVLLLDECDVFLEARSAHHLERNMMVSIFLRTLEYFEGILFLTTNRVENMDPAFASRIHISLNYPDLDEAARRQVWKNFLSNEAGMVKAVAGEGGWVHAVTEEDVARLAALDMNGRQIKNVLKTANLLACQQGDILRLGHIRTVLTIQGQEME